MLSPKKVKYRKRQKGRLKGKPNTGVAMAFGEYGLKATEAGWISNRQIEAGRVVITRHVKRGGRLWIRVFPDKPVTKKPTETRMGKGKGTPEGWVAVIKRGKMIYELAGVPEPVAKEALRLASHKLSVATKYVKRAEAYEI